MKKWIAKKITSLLVKKNFAVWYASTWFAKTKLSVAICRWAVCEDMKRWNWIHVSGGSFPSVEK